MFLELELFLESRIEYFWNREILDSAHPYFKRTPIPIHLYPTKKWFIFFTVINKDESLWIFLHLLFMLFDGITAAVPSHFLCKYSVFWGICRCLPGYSQLGDLSSWHAFCQMCHFWTESRVVKLLHLQPPKTNSATQINFKTFFLRYSIETNTLHS